MQKVAMLVEWNSSDTRRPLIHLFDSCLIYCSQVAISVNIRADDVVSNTVHMKCLLTINHKKENRKHVVHILS